MSTNNLRPDLKIKQEFTPVTPNVPTSRLPVLLIGVNRHFEYKTATSLTDWNAGSQAAGVEFPNWLGGAVDASDATLEAVRPHIYVQNDLGIAEITDVTWHLGTTPPTFDIAAGADAIFSLTSGTTGAFAVDSTDPTLGAFTDVNADFVATEAAAGDSVYINGVATYQVYTNGLVSDEELTVRRLDKGPSTAGTTEATKILISAEDTNDVRTLTVYSDSFEAAGGFTGTGVKVNDLVRLDNWDVVSNGFGAGIKYTYTGEDSGTTESTHLIASTERKVTFPSAPSRAASPWNNTIHRGTVFFVLNTVGDLVPSFYATTSPKASVKQWVKNYASSSLLAEADEDNGAVYRAYKYLPVAAVSPRSTGVFTAQDVDGYRSFSDASSATLDHAAIGQHIAIPDSDGVYRPVFAVASPGTTLKVTQFSDELMLTDSGATNVTYVLLSPGTPDQFLGGTLSETTAHIVSEGGTAAVLSPYTLSGAERAFTVAGATFSPLNAPMGSMLFTDRGYLLGYVSYVDSPGAASDTLALVTHEYAGISLGAGETMSNVGYSIRQGGKRADFRVRRIVNSISLEIVELSSTPNPITGTTQIKGAIYFQTPTAVTTGTHHHDDVVTEAGTDPVLVIAPDSSGSLSYEIKKTRSGSNLEGDILLTYSEIRNDDLTIQEVNANTYSDVLGDAVPANPLGMAAAIVAQNTPTEFYALQVETDDVSGWTAAFNAAKSATVYSIVPLTQSEAILTLARNHVTSESSEDNKRERILYQSSKFYRTVERTAKLSTETVTVTRTAGGVQTIASDRDLSLEGVIVSDVISGVAFDGTTQTEFTGVITNVTVSGGTVLTVLPDGNIPKSTSGLAIISYTIDSKYLTDTAFRDAIAAYPGNLANRRVRNIFPYTLKLSFTDTVGIYDGGAITDYEDGAHYQCAMEGSKRAKYGPVKPLTKTEGAGIQAIIDPFEGNNEYQDVIINAGHYYVEQPNGENSGVMAIRAITTDVTDLVFLEDCVTTQIDSFARKLRQQLKPLLGPYILDEGFFVMLSAQQAAVVKETIDNKEMKTIELVSILEDPNTPDTFQMVYAVEPYFSAARGEITIFV